MTRWPPHTKYVMRDFINIVNEGWVDKLLGRDTPDPIGDIVGLVADLLEHEESSWQIKMNFQPGVYHAESSHTFRLHNAKSQIDIAGSLFEKGRVFIQSLMVGGKQIFLDNKKHQKRLMAALKQALQDHQQSGDANAALGLAQRITGTTGQQP